ncbi:MAG: alanine:cation symporter family protein, partial [Oleibacter sp.]|nr:alanine:cation symporter family protein [Thalassolituus sp.]
TSIVANYTYAENALVHLGFGSKEGITILRICALLMVVWGANEAVATVFNFADASMGLMATVNLIAIVLLSGTVAKLTKDYFAQRKLGQNPRFKAAEYPELKGKIDGTIWR